MKELDIVGTNEKAYVDDDVYERAKQYSWRFCGKGYIGTGVNVVYLHVFVMGIQTGKEVDHKNGNKLDCQRHNLRFLTHSENMHNCGMRHHNTSGYIGVDYREERGKFRARLAVNGYRFHLGYFDTAIEAACAYDKEVIKRYGNKCISNFPATVDHEFFLALH